jgi:serine/threonine-protein kinase
MNTAGLCGRKVDRYQVERLVGSGGFGAVYRARHTRTGAWVALKVLKRVLGSDPQMLDRFMREAQAAAAIGDDHVVRVLDAEVTEDEIAFIAMELLEGRDLKELYEAERPLAPLRIIELIVQVLDGLQAAHEKGVVHRDMKPGNVFIVEKVDASGRLREVAKLLDFGISKIVDLSDDKRLTATGAAMGTPGYMAYEQFFNAHEVDGRADLYAVAAMTFELLAGRKPFEAPTLAEMLVLIKTTLPPQLRSVAPSLPTPLCAVVDKGLARKRERRWNSAKEMAQALRDLRRLLPPAAEHVTRPRVQRADDHEARISTQPPDQTLLKSKR